MHKCALVNKPVGQAQSEIGLSTYISPMENQAATLTTLSTAQSLSYALAATKHFLAC